MSENVLPIDTAESSLEILGGKGRSLARMANAGMAVPGGFYVTTSAYRRFVEENTLQELILDTATPEVSGRTVSFDTASAEIAAIFGNAAVPAEITSAIREAYADLDGDAPPVAVRSSATAEDLPDMSFAGQQDTYLNVSGEEALLDAVGRCWASLWTPRAISYRHQMGVPHDQVAMAVVVQLMVPSEVSGILFTANPATGERSEMVVNSSFGLGEAVVGGDVTPDTYIVDRETLTAKETIIGTKEQKIVSDGAQGTRFEEITEDDRGQSSLSDAAIQELGALALDVEKEYQGVPQDIEWAFCYGTLHLLQSRPITNLPPQPIEVSWEPVPPAQILARRQIVENIPDPCTPLFEELYLTEGLEMMRKGEKRPNLMVGGGPMFVTLNGYAYQRFDFPMVIEARDKLKGKAMTEMEMDAAETKIEAAAQEKKTEKATSTAEEQMAARMKSIAHMARHDLDLFLEDLSEEDRKAFDAWSASMDAEEVAQSVTVPKSKNLTFGAFNRIQINEKQIKEFYDVAKPEIVATTEAWEKVDAQGATDQELLAGMIETGTAGGLFWSRNASHTFGVAKSTDDQLQAFLGEALPDQKFTSGQFLSGFKSHTMEANEHLFEIAQAIRADVGLSELVITTPPKQLMAALVAHTGSEKVVAAISEYLEIYGHLGYSLDFVEVLPVEDPSGLLATLKTMITNKDYDPRNHEVQATKKREKAMEDVLELLDGLPYWQFCFRHWFTHRFYFIREEVMFYLYKPTVVFRPLALELGQRLADAGTISERDDIFYLVTEELEKAIAARKENRGMPEYQALAAERKELREARKRLHPPGTVPFDASDDPNVKFKETQFVNDPTSDTLQGVPVSSGSITASVSLINSPAEFDQMEPGSILVCPMTNPAWTPLFAHASGLVTDMGGILGHGSIVAREYGIPAVVGTGTITQRVKHGQQITVDGDAGFVKVLEEETEN